MTDDHELSVDSAALKLTVDEAKFVDELFDRASTVLLPVLQKRCLTDLRALAEADDELIESDTSLPAGYTPQVIRTFAGVARDQMLFGRREWFFIGGIFIGALATIISARLWGLVAP